MSVSGSVKGWLWFTWKFGPQRAFHYWRAGTRRGWMTPEQSAEFLSQLVLLTEMEIAALEGDAPVPRATLERSDEVV